MVDYFIENPKRLEGQPKRTIADYVESNGILVPRRFSSLREARSSGAPIICRSEHTQDYDGTSGLLGSPDLSKLPDTNNESELTAKIIDNLDFRIGRYCKLMNLDEANFREGISFSFWEKMGGYNRMVVADNSIKGRYHVMTLGQKCAAYSIFEDGKISHISGSTNDTVEELANLVQLYESVRHLDQFDSNNCPIMEFQTVDGRNYFLQYHRSREFKPAEFQLNRWRRWGEKKAIFVRGATRPEGVTLKLAFDYPDSWHESPAPQSEDGFYGAADITEVYRAVMAKRWKLNVIPTIENLEFTLWDAVAIGHVTRNQLHKPEVSLIVNRKGFMNTKEWYKLKDSCVDEPVYIDVFAISDGRKAYVKIV